MVQAMSFFHLCCQIYCTRGIACSTLTFQYQELVTVTLCKAVAACSAGVVHSVLPCYRAGTVGDHFSTYPRGQVSSGCKEMEFWSSVLMTRSLKPLNLIWNWCLNCCYLKPYVPLNYFGSNNGDSVRNRCSTEVRAHQRANWKMYSLYSTTLFISSCGQNVIEGLQW